jgi:hypothetical protein
MTLFKFTTDKIVRRLRWTTLLVMLLDAVITVIGQPASFWHDPSTTTEGNPIVRFFLARGIIPYVVVGSLYVAGTLVIASITPKRIGLTILFFTILGHSFGFTTWLRYHFHCSTSISLLRLGIAALIMLAVYQEKD